MNGLFCYCYIWISQDVLRSPFKRCLFVHILRIVYADMGSCLHLKLVFGEFCILAAATADRKDPSGCGKTTVYFPTGCTLGRHSEGDPGVPGVRNSQEDLAVVWQSEEE